jgi:hypothetical protein
MLILIAKIIVTPIAIASDILRISVGILLWDGRFSDYENTPITLTLWSSKN